MSGRVVRLRLVRFGKKKQPSFRLCACDAKTPRGGRALEILGTYDPLARDEVKRFALRPDRIRHWLSLGAQPTEAARAILCRHKITLPAQPTQSSQST